MSTVSDPLNFLSDLLAAANKKLGARPSHPNYFRGHVQASWGIPGVRKLGSIIEREISPNAE